MDRRDFLRRASLIAAGVVAADQLEIIDRLTHVRRFFPSAYVGDPVFVPGSPPWFTYDATDGITMGEAMTFIYDRALTDDEIRRNAAWFAREFDGGRITTWTRRSH